MNAGDSVELTGIIIAVKAEGVVVKIPTVTGSTLLLVKPRQITDNLPPPGADTALMQTINEAEGLTPPPTEPAP